MSGSKFESLSSSGDLFAYSIPCGIIKFWDTISGKLIHEFQPAAHLCAQPTCILFLQSNETGIAGVSGNFDKDLLAIGNLAGKVLIYSPKQERLISTLALNSGASIVDVSWQTNSTVVSLSSDKSLTAWDVSTGKKLSEHTVDGNRSLCSLGGNIMVVAGYNLQMFKLNEHSIDIMTTYIGKSQEIVQLLPLLVKSEPVAKYFLSALKGSKLLYSWLAERKENEYLNRSLVVFNAEESIEMVRSYQLETNLTGILCTTKKGALKYFTTYFNDDTEPKAPQRIKAEVIIRSEQLSKNLPILGAYFLSKEMIIICYGSSVNLSFERIPIDSLIDRKVLIREDPLLVNKDADRNALRTITPKILTSTSFLTGAHVSIPEGARKRKRIRI